MRIQRILSGGDNRSPSEASASIRVKSVFEKKLGGDETNTDSTDFIRDGVQSKKDFKHTTFRYPLNKSGMVTTAWITSE